MGGAKYEYGCTEVSIILERLVTNLVLMRRHDGRHFNIKGANNRAIGGESTDRSIILYLYLAQILCENLYFDIIVFLKNSKAIKMVLLRNNLTKI